MRVKWDWLPELIVLVPIAVAVVLIVREMNKEKEDKDGV